VVILCTATFNIKNFDILSTDYIDVFCTYLRKKATSALYNINWLFFYNWNGACLLRCLNWVFEHNKLRFTLKGFMHSTLLVRCKFLRNEQERQ
jgi:hypothetical protein